MAKLQRQPTGKRSWIPRNRLHCPKCGKETRIVKRMKDREARRARRNLYFVLGLRVFEKL